MREKNIFQKNITAIIFVLSAMFFGSFQSVFAEEPSASSTPVTFTVKIGELSCRNGEGESSVFLDNTPTEGGYYEVTGEMITKNRITLSRRVELPSGTYEWKGFANNGYILSGVASGTFTVKDCPPKQTMPTQTLKGEEQQPIENQVIPKTEEESKNNEGKIALIASSSETATTSVLSIFGEKISLPVVIYGLLLIVIVSSFMGYRSKLRKQQDS